MTAPLWLVALSGAANYQSAPRQHLLIYADMDTVAVDLDPALERLRPELRKALDAAHATFDTVSVITTQCCLVLDVAGACKILPISAPEIDRI